MSADDLALVRSFNHTVIHWISVLDEGCVHSGLSAYARRSSLGSISTAALLPLRPIGHA
jgi:hypothetical protein